MSAPRPIALLALCAALLLAGCGGPSTPGGEATAADGSGQPAESTGSSSAQDETGAEAAAPSIAPLARGEVVVYFPSAFADALQGERREIFNTASPVDRAKQIVSDLISGPSDENAIPALPPGTRLKQVYVLDSGMAFADFSVELRDGIGGGSSTEMLAVYSIVNSLALNIPEIDRVGILVEGRPCETLNGHMDLRRPLPPKIGLLVEPFDRYTQNDPAPTGQPPDVI